MGETVWLMEGWLIGSIDLYISNNLRLKHRLSAE